jgi:hypothetical protein
MKSVDAAKHPINGTRTVYFFLAFTFEPAYSALLANDWRFVVDGVVGSYRLPENVIAKIRQLHLALSALRLLLPLTSVERKT